MMTWAMGPVMKTWRRRLGLGRGVLRGSPQTIYQFSPGLNPPDPAWGPHVHVTGEWLSPDPAPPLREDVEDFLQRGEAPLLVSFGSVASDRLRDLWRWTREVLVEQGLRAIIVDPDQGSGESDGLLTVDRVPFTVVLPRCRAVLCHGSLGTTGAALRAGLPCLTVAFGGDQQFHAQAVRRNGAGPAYIDAQRGELTRRALGAGVADLVSGGYDQAARTMPQLLSATRARCGGRADGRTRRNPGGLLQARGHEMTVMVRRGAFPFVAERGGGLLVFCFHHAGGNASAYRGWSAPPLGSMRFRWNCRARLPECGSAG